MPLPEIFTPQEHAAYTHGLNVGYDHANCVDADGVTSEDPAMPERFTDVKSTWRAGYEEGVNSYAAGLEEEQFADTGRSDAWGAEDLSPDLDC